MHTNPCILTALISEPNGIPAIVLTKCPPEWVPVMFKL